MQNVILFLLLCASAYASDTEFSGYVTDPAGASVHGATVTLECDGRTTSELTGVDGSFSLTFTAGVCTIEVVKKGFEPVVVPVAPSGEPLLVSLSLAEVHQQLTVTGKSEALAVNPAGNIDTVEADQETLESLPVMDHDYIGFMSGFLADGLTGSDGYSLVVDGMEADKLGVSASAIEQVQINKNPYSAEFQSPGRGRIEVTTRKGSEALHGSFTVLWRDHRLYARNAFATTRPPESRRVLEGHLTGPLSKDGRTSFLVSAEYEQDNDWATIFAQTPGGLVSDQVFQPEREKEFSFRVNRLIGENQSLSVRYKYETGKDLNSGPGGFTLSETAANEYGREHEILASHSALFGNRFLNEMRLEFEDEHDQTESVIQNAPRVVVLDSFTSGGAQQDSLGQEYGFDFADVVSWNHNNHYLRAGGSVNDLSHQDYLDRTGRDGTFYFGSLDDYLQGKPFSFEQKTGDGRVSFWSARLAGFFQDDWRVRPNLSLGLGLRYEYHVWPHGQNNFAPRLSLAYAPGSERRIIFRGGLGIFYDRIGSSTVRSTLLNDGERLREIQISDPSYPVPGGVIPAHTVLPANIVRFAPGLNSPILLNYSAGLERMLWEKTVLSVSYSGVQGSRLFRSRDLNTPAPPDFVRPDPSLATVQQLESTAKLTSHAVDVSLRGRIGNHISGGVLYTLGRSYNDTGGSGWMPPNPYDLSREWARASFNRTHRFRSYGTVDLWGLFDLGTVFSVYSGNPYSIKTGRDDNRDGRANDRPVGVPRNSMTEFGRLDLDVQVAREFKMPLRHDAEAKPTLRFAADIFNAINHVNYDRFVGNISSPFFGQPVAARSPRRIQLSLRLKF